MRTLTTPLAKFMPIKLPYSRGMIQHLFKIFIIRDIYHKKIKSIIFSTTKLYLTIIKIVITIQCSVQKRCKVSTKSL